jgi:hypothetical protein
MLLRRAVPPEKINKSYKTLFSLPFSILSAIHVVVHLNPCDPSGSRPTRPPPHLHPAALAPPAGRPLSFPPPRHPESVARPLTSSCPLPFPPPRHHKIAPDPSSLPRRAIPPRAADGLPPSDDSLSPSVAAGRAGAPASGRLYMSSALQVAPSRHPSAAHAGRAGAPARGSPCRSRRSSVLGRPCTRDRSWRPRRSSRAAPPSTIRPLQPAGRPREIPRHATTRRPLLPADRRSSHAEPPPVARPCTPREASHGKVQEIRGKTVQIYVFITSLSATCCFFLI